MLKKLVPSIASVAALLAFTAPAASATGPLITDALGEAATAIEAESTNTEIVAETGTFTCETVKLSGQITTNANTAVHASGEAGQNPPGEHCGPGPFHFDNIRFTLFPLHLTHHAGTTIGTGNLSHTYMLTTIFGNIHCTFEGTVPVIRTGTDTINVNGQLVGSGHEFLCAQEGTFNGDFTVLDQNGDPATIH